MKFAFINDSVVKKIADVDEEVAISQGHLYQQVLPVEDMSPEPEEGWEFVDGVIRKYYPEITPRQMRQALVISGVNLSTVYDALNSLPEPTKSLAIISWDYAVAFDRYDPLIDGVSAMLGWGPGEIDALWDLGMSL